MSITEKVEHILSLSDCDRCFASRERSTIIDVLHPNTGRTVCYGKTLEDCREEYPDAEEMSVDEFCAWKASQQRTPITWDATAEEKYHDMLNVLPPAKWTGGAFLVGEPWDHDAGNGRPRFAAFRKRGEVYQTANRPLTIPEFLAEIS